jgi:hypothetical protein
MPLTSKGKEIRSALVKEYGHDKGRQVFYAMKNEGKITGVDDAHIAPHLKGIITKLRDGAIALTARMDAFQQQQHQRKPKDVKPRTKDGMQPSNPHPKEVG